MASESVFRAEELGYLHERRRLGPVATVGSDGTRHVVPSGFVHNLEIDVTGGALEQTRKHRNVARDGRAAIVTDPQWIVSWGLASERSARTVNPAPDAQQPPADQESPS